MSDDEIIHLLRAPRHQDIWREEDLYNVGITPDFIGLLLEKKLVKPRSVGVYLQDDLDQIYNLLILQKSFRLDLSLVRPLFRVIGQYVIEVKLRDIDLLAYSSEALNVDERAIGDMLISSLRKVFVYLRSHATV